MGTKKHFLLFTLFYILASGCVQDTGRQDPLIKEPDGMKITSSAFAEKEFIPKKYTCNGDNINPPLEIRGIPNGTKSLVLIVDDPDAPVGVWDHWVLWNIQPVSEITEDSVPSGAIQGQNSALENKYYGPCPPYGTHRYRFNVYALDSLIDLSEKSRRRDLEAVMGGRILAQATLTGVVAA